MVKAGILSLYYDNANYGGLLQAYAMTTALMKIGICGEQICFNSSSTKNPLEGTELTKKEKIKKFGLGYVAFSVTLKWRQRRKKAELRKNVLTSEQKALIKKRIDCLKCFEQQEIPHTEKVYEGNNIQECIVQYDAFICGSDQVWNPSLIRDEYLLKFVPAEKSKIAYAASVSRDFLTDYQREYMCQALKEFSAISVREKSAISLLGKGLQNQIINMPDPTCLLTRKDWEDLIKREENKAAIEGEYILCYFLGNDKKHRSIVKKIASKYNLKTVGFPHMSGEMCYADVQVKYDYEEYECSPARFVELIKGAKYIVTDSFHATVFSIIFKRDFFVFKRENASYGNSMFSRLADLLESTGLSSRIVGNRIREFENKMSDTCDFTTADKWLAEENARGIGFLKKAIEKRG